MSSYDNAEPEGGASGRPGRSAPTKNPSKRSASSSIRSVQPGPKGKPAGPKKAPGQKPDEPVAPSKSELNAISESRRRRSKSARRAGPKSHPNSGTASSGLLIGALTCFIIAEAQESYIAITVLEIFIVILFILIYMLTLHHLLTYIHWPLLDLINSFITTVFLLIVAILTIQEKERRHLFYVGGALCLAAAIVCLVDATLVTKMVRKAMKKALGLEGEAKASPAGEEPHQPPKPESEKMLSPAPPEPAARLFPRPELTRCHPCRPTHVTIKSGPLSRERFCFRVSPCVQVQLPFPAQGTAVWGGGGGGGGGRGGPEALDPALLPANPAPGPGHAGREGSPGRRRGPGGGRGWAGLCVGAGPGRWAGRWAALCGAAGGRGSWWAGGRRRAGPVPGRPSHGEQGACRGHHAWASLVSGRWLSSVGTRRAQGQACPGTAQGIGRAVSSRKGPRRDGRQRQKGGQTSCGGPSSSRRQEGGRATPGGGEAAPRGGGGEGEGGGEEGSRTAPPPPKPKSVQPKDEVGTRKGCRRYRWELKDSNKEFWVMGHAEVKILSVGCLIAALVMFTGTVVHPLLTLIISMELSVFLFFIIVYSFAINRYMPFILWPITDLLNDLFATAFLAGATAFAVQTRQTMPMNYFIAVVSLPCGAAYLLRNHLFLENGCFPPFEGHRIAFHRILQSKQSLKLLTQRQKLPPYPQTGFKERKKQWVTGHWGINKNILFTKKKRKETRNEIGQLRGEKQKSREAPSVFQILIGVAAFFPLIDICLQRKHFRGKKVKRNVLVPPQRKADAAKAKEEAKPGRQSRRKTKRESQRRRQSRARNDTKKLVVGSGRAFYNEAESHCLPCLLPQ
ncbi:hypothetical protein QTO34_010662 [Cnephaeus nilssonii]|uniref:MARVEL domain-containing protein n=1 Tax=Cnephaeus nilssonii TaxID=3371016 RepID=A0AA40HG13_CNENI|nr:hypothetical protein QTO34_010662 [Eptesicus nilssonii]